MPFPEKELRRPTHPTLNYDKAAWRAEFVSGNSRRDEDWPYPNESIESLSWTAGRIEGAAKPKGTLPQLRPITRA